MRTLRFDFASKTFFILFTEMQSPAPTDSGNLPELLVTESITANQLKKEEEEGSPCSLISQVDIPEHLQCYITLQSMLNNISESEIENISKFVFHQSPEFHTQAIQIMISFHEIRPLQRSLITKLISKTSSKSPLNLRFLIEEHPFLAFHLRKSEFYSQSEQARIESEILSITQKFYKSFFPLFRLLRSPESLNPYWVPESFRDRFKAEDFGVEEVREWGCERSSLCWILKFDEFERLRDRSAHPRFEFATEIIISEFDLPFGSYLGKQSLLSVSVFYGGLVCFKYVLLNGIGVTG
jgi:hypothetical protein